MMKMQPETEFGKKDGKLTLMFFSPHPDDIEIGVPFQYINGVRRGDKIIEVLMTNGEFGTDRDEFKGKRLVKIRAKELENSNNILIKNINPNNRIKLIRLGYIDGHLPFTNKTIQRITDLIKQESPHIIFTCDPWYVQDYHPDHVNTGRLVYFALKRLKKSELPLKVFYYYTTKADTYLKCNWSDFKIVKLMQSQHKSQYSPFENKIFITIYNKLSVIKHFFECGYFSESFRSQKFNNNKIVSPKPFNKMGFSKRILYYILNYFTEKGYKKFHNLSIEDLKNRGQI